MNQAFEAAGTALHFSPSTLARMRFGGDDTLPSAFRVTELAAGTIGAAALAVAELIGAQAGAGPRVTVDRRLASLWFGQSIAPLG